ncbi:MAG: hypothetical protein ACE5JE_05485 [Thermoplasmata archaeon]
MAWPVHTESVRASSAGTFHLTVTSRATRLLRHLEESSLHTTVRWVPGPCRDDWCGPIPKLRVRPGSPPAREKGNSVHRVVQGIDVYVPESVAETAARNQDRLQIDGNPFTRKFRLRGLTYGLRPPARLHS